jgi:hypothetical protein
MIQSSGFLDSFPQSLPTAERRFRYRENKNPNKGGFLDIDVRIVGPHGKTIHQVLFSRHPDSRIPFLRSDQDHCQLPREGSDTFKKTSVFGSGFNQASGAGSKIWDSESGLDPDPEGQK